MRMGRLRDTARQRADAAAEEAASAEATVAHREHELAQAEADHPPE